MNLESQHSDSLQQRERVLLMHSIPLPAKHKEGCPQEKIDVSQSVCIMGPTGSGKSRMGAWIEERLGRRCHRIGAQRSLDFTPVTQNLNLEKALRFLRTGLDSSDQSPESFDRTRKGWRWQSAPTGKRLDDAGYVLAALLAQDANVSRDFRQGWKTKKHEGEPESTCIDKVFDLFHKYLPERRLCVRDGFLQCHELNGEPYPATEMSDGERSVVYLAGQVVLAEEQTVLIIDEPERHLDRALLANFWSELEQIRKDCAFVYITHDVEFSSSRNDGKIIWVKSYKNSYYQWEIIDDFLNVPSEMGLKLLGSKKPIILVEGKQQSIDAKLYQNLYPGFRVLSCGSSSTVKSAAEGIKALPTSLVNVRCFGIIDRDYLSEEEASTLSEKDILVLDVAEGENLLCLPEVVYAVAEHQGHEEQERTSLVSAVKDKIIEEFRGKKDQCKWELAKHRASRALSSFGPQDSDFKIPSLNNAANDLKNRLDSEIFKIEDSQNIDTICEKRDYEKILRAFNHKGILQAAATCFRLRVPDYKRIIFRLIQMDPAGIAASAMRRKIKLNAP